MSKKIYPGLDPAAYDLVKSAMQAFAKSLEITNYYQIDNQLWLDEVHAQTGIERDSLVRIIADVLVESLTSGARDTSTAWTYPSTSALPTGSDTKFTTPSTSYSKPSSSSSSSSSSTTTSTLSSTLTTSEDTKASFSSTSPASLSSSGFTVTTSSSSPTITLTGDSKLASSSPFDIKAIAEGRTTLSRLESEINESIAYVESFEGARATPQNREAINLAQARGLSLGDQLKDQFKKVTSSLNQDLLNAFDSQYKNSGPLSFFPSVEAASLEVNTPIEQQISTLEIMELTLGAHVEKTARMVEVHDKAWASKTSFPLGECSLCFDSVIPTRSSGTQTIFMKNAIAQTAHKIFLNIEGLTPGYFRAIEDKNPEVKSMDFKQLNMMIREIGALELQYKEIEGVTEVPVDKNSSGLLSYYNTQKTALSLPYKIQKNVKIVEQFMKVAVHEHVINVQIPQLKEGLSKLPSEQQRTTLIEAIKTHKQELGTEKITYSDLLKPTLLIGKGAASLEAREEICEKETLISCIQDLLGSLGLESTHSLSSTGDIHHDYSSDHA